MHTEMITTRADLWKILAQNDLKGNIAELGVAEGLFSRDMLAWPWKFSTLYMVDRWKQVYHDGGDSSFPQAWHDQNFLEATGRVARFGKRAVILRGDTDKMAQRVPDHTLALVYIDADHRYDSVLRDIYHWKKKLVPGGVMAFHDFASLQYGVNSAVQDFCRDTGIPFFVIPETQPKDTGAFFYVN